MTKHKSESLADFFNSIGGEKKKLKEEKSKIIGDLSLDNLFSSMEEESRKIKEEKKQLKKDVEAFKNLLFKEEKKEEKPSVDEYIEPPRPEEEIADAIRQSEGDKEETVVEHAVKILDKINEEVETVETEPDLAKLKKEIEILKQVVYEQGGGGEVRLEFLDDVDRDSVKVNGKVLQYQASSGKFIGATSSGIGTEDSLNTSGIITASSFVGNLTGNVNSSGISTFTNNIQLRSDDGTPGRIDLYCEVSNAHYLRLQAPAHSAFSGNPTVVLPNSAGTIALTSSNITGTAALAQGLTGTPSISVVSVSASGISTFTNNIQLKSGDGDPARVDFYCESGNSHYTRLKSAPHSEYSGNVSIVLPIKSGDVIVGDTSGNITQNINTTGIITATSFIGNVTGNLTGTASAATLATNAQGLTGTPSISVVDIASRHINSSGVVTATSFVGDGSGLTGLSSGIAGISTTGTSVFNNINSSGVVTATTFVGNLTGNPTGTIQTAAQPNITSLGTLSSLNVSGDVSIGGTLTYEDVTSIDSVGLITARSGMVVSGISTFLGSQKGINVVGVSSFAGAINANGGVTGDLTGNADTATKLATARTIGGVSFDGSANINLPGVNSSGNQDTSGNAATATALETARTIGGVSFDGTGNINLPGVNSSGNQDTSGNASTATVATNAQGLTGTPNVAVGNITVTGDLTVEGTTNSQTSTDTTVTGILTATSINVGSTAAGIGVTLNQGGGVYSGIITATTFVGNVTGNVTGNATGLSGTPNVSVGNLTGTSAVVGSAVTVNSTGVDAGAGIVTATKFSGNTAQGGGNDSVFQMNGMTVTQDFEFPDGQSAMSVGPITINSGVEVTVPDGQNWVIL